MKRTTILVLMLAAIGTLQAQTVKGTVSNAKDGAPLPYTNVTLMRASDTTFLRGTTTDSKGRFSLDADTVASLLRISAIGFETLLMPVTDGPMDIQMTEGSTTLDAVEITAAKPMYAADGEKKIYNVRLFPNIRWIPSRSANPREAHRKFWNRIWPKNDPFWNENTPGSLWNCKCDWEQTSKPVTDGNPSSRIAHKGLTGNPAKTGQIFTDSHPYIAKAPKDTPTTVIRTVRDIFRDKHADDFVVFKTDIGKILFDDITAIEISKGAKTDASYFYKQEIAQHFDAYVEKMQLVNPHEDIDSTHNNHNNKFYRRKSQFSCMRVYTLAINGYIFQIKLGEFKTGGYHLYSITEP